MSELNEIRVRYEKYKTWSPYGDEPLTKLFDDLRANPVRDIGLLLTLLDEGREIVRLLMWTEHEEIDGFVYECEGCEIPRREEHAPDCKLNEWLKRVKHD